MISKNADVPVAARRPVADIEEDAAFPARGQRRIQLSIGKHFLAMARKAMRVNVTRTQLVAQQRADVAFLRDLSEVHHHRQPGEVPGLDGTVDRGPARTLI